MTTAVSRKLTRRKKAELDFIAQSIFEATLALEAKKKFPFSTGTDPF